MTPEAYGLTTVGDRWPCQCSGWAATPSLHFM